MSDLALEIELTTDFRAKLNTLANQNKIDPAALARVVLERYLHVFENHVAAIAEGIDDANAGRVVDHDQVVAWVESWDSDHELEPPICD